MKRRRKKTLRFPFTDESSRVLSPPPGVVGGAWTRGPGWEIRSFFSGAVAASGPAHLSPAARVFPTGLAYLAGKGQIHGL